MKVALFCGLIVFSTPVYLQSPDDPTFIDLPDFKGWSAAQLKTVFPIEVPNAPDWEAGVETTINNWKGWEKIVFHFNGKGRLSSIDFFFNKLIPLQKAHKLCKTNLNVRLVAENRVSAPGLLAYRGLQGAIRTVNFLNHDDPFNWENGINNLYFKYDIAWAE